MSRILLRVVLNALAIFFLFPVIDGISFHGNAFEAIGLAFFFTLLGWLVEVVAVVASRILAVGTFGLALLLLIPMWIFGFWLLPAVALKLLAHLLPQYLAISGWLPAILGGLALLFIEFITAGPKRIVIRRQPPRNKK